MMDAQPEYPPRFALCVGAVVQRADTVLFVRQTYGDTLTNTWTLPWGFVDSPGLGAPADAPHQAALREVLEEGGIHAEIEGLLGIQEHVDPRGNLRVYFLFLCRDHGGDPVPDGAETDRAAFLSLADLDALTDPVDPFCRWLVERVLYGEAHLIPPNAQNPYAPHMAFL